LGVEIVSPLCIRFVVQDEVLGLSEVFIAFFGLTFVGDSVGVVGLTTHV
jgi:hypothetical protein